MFTKLDELAEKTYKDKKLSYFSVIVSRISDEKKKELTVRAYDDNMPSFYTVIIEGYSDTKNNNYEHIVDSNNLSVIDYKSTSGATFKSGYFFAERGEILSIYVNSSIIDGTAELYLLDPNKKEKKLIFGNESKFDELILEEEGFWEYQCSFFGNGNIEILGRIKNNSISKTFNAGNNLNENLYVNRSDSLKKDFEKYNSYGVTYDSEQDAVYYKGEVVKLFADFNQNKEEDMIYSFDLCYRDSKGDSTLYLQAIKDNNANIIGIQPLSDETAFYILEKMGMNDDYNKASVKSDYQKKALYLNMDATFVIESANIVANDLTKDKVNNNEIKTWLNECDKKQGTYIFKQKNSNEYDTYIYHNGSGRYPWTIDLVEDDLKIKFYSNSPVSTDDGYCLIRYSAPKDFQKINIYIDNIKLNLN